MAYVLPTFEELLDRAIKRHRAELPGTDAYLWPNTEHVFLKAATGIVFSCFEYLQWVKRQRFVTEADDSELDAHGKPWKITRKPAVAAHGNVQFTGTVGTSIAAGTVVQRSDGAQFATSTAVVIDSDGVVAVEAVALTAGAAGNTDALTELELVVPDAAVTLVKVDGIGLGAGADVEDGEQYRERIWQRQSNEPMGGSVPDYVRWVLAVPGVTRVWVERRTYGPGTVGIWPMSDGSTADGIPSAVLIADIETFLDGLIPATARAIVKAPIAAAIDIKIAGITPTTAMQEQIAAEIADLFRRRVSVSMRGASYVVNPAIIWQAVARITGDVTHRIVLPIETTIPFGYVPVMGTLCYDS